MLIALTPLTAASIMAVRNNLLSRMEHLAHHDHLTGVLNRTGFWPMAQSMLATQELRQLPVAVGMLDLDHFKRVNDSHGHESGDHLLRAFTDTVRHQLRQGDLFVRLGGEEFAIVLPATTQSQALEVVERLREKVAEMSMMDASGQPIVATVSIGLACQQRGTYNLDRLLSRADQALYLAKRHGRNRVELHREDAPDDRDGSP